VKRRRPLAIAVGLVAAGVLAVGVATSGSGVASTATPAYVGTAYGHNLSPSTAEFSPAPAALRVFSSTSTWPVLVPGVHRECVSIKPDVAAFAAGVYDAETVALFKQAQALGITLYPTLWHEIDAKGRPAIPAWQAAMEHLVALAAPYPNVRPLVILTAYGLVHHTPWQQYMVPGILRVGADFDGLHGYPYPDYTPELAALEQVRAAGYAVMVPEFGAPQQSADPNGTQLAAWLTSWAQRLGAGGAVFVDLWADPVPGGQSYVLTSPAPIAAWQALEAASH